MPDVLQKASNFGGGATSRTATLAAPATAGNGLLVIGATLNNTSANVTDPSGYGTARAVAGTTGTQVLKAWFKLAAGGETTATVAVTTAGNIELHFYEISGVDPDLETAWDVTATNQALGSGQTSASSGTTATAAVRPGLAVAAVSTNAGGAFGSIPAFTNGYDDVTDGIASSSRLLASAVHEHSGGGALETTASWTTAGTPRALIVNIIGPEPPADPTLSNAILIGAVG